VRGKGKVNARAQMHTSAQVTTKNAAFLVRIESSSLKLTDPERITTP
jgi:hypothetical protein